jgi:hypothetical protein
MKGSNVCKKHGEQSAGPKIEQGRQRCAAAKTIHGFETRKARTEQVRGLRMLRELEDLGYLLGVNTGLKTPGKKPQ